MKRSDTVLDRPPQAGNPQPTFISSRSTSPTLPGTATVQAGSCATSVAAWAAWCGMASIAECTGRCCPAVASAIWRTCRGQKVLCWRLRPGN